MKWVKKECPTVPNLLQNLEVYAKRLLPIRLCNLLKCRSHWIEEFMKSHKITTYRDAIEFVIINIDYPFTWWGAPTDKHVWNAFNGKACFTLKYDYWQTAWETLMTYVLNQKLKGAPGYGDCEDTAILTTSLLRFLGAKAYVCMGLVFLKEGQELKLLGGHGWSIAELEDGEWHLIETTLDVPLPYPKGYPVINPDDDKYIIDLGTKKLIYRPILRFNESEYWELIDEEREREMEAVGVDVTKPYRIFEYATLTRKHKHSRKKFKAMRKFWSEVSRNARWLV